MQDEIVQKIVSRLAGEIEAAEIARVMRKPTQNLLAYEYVLRGRSHFSRRTRAENTKARHIRRLNPFFDVTTFGSAFQNPADRQKLVAGLLKAGL